MKVKSIVIAQYSSSTRLAYKDATFVEDRDFSYVHYKSDKNQDRVARFPTESIAFIDYELEVVH